MTRAYMSLASYGICFTFGAFLGRKVLMDRLKISFLVLSEFKQINFYFPHEMIRKPMVV